MDVHLCRSHLRLDDPLLQETRVAIRVLCQQLGKALLEQLAVPGEEGLAHRESRCMSPLEDFFEAPQDCFTLACNFFPEEVLHHEIDVQEILFVLQVGLPLARRSLHDVRHAVRISARNRVKERGAATQYCGIGSENSEEVTVRSPTPVKPIEELCAPGTQKKSPDSDNPMMSTQFQNGPPIRRRVLQVLPKVVGISLGVLDEDWEELAVHQCSRLLDKPPFLPNIPSQRRQLELMAVDSS